MSHIQKLGPHRWQARWRDPSNRERSKVFAKKSAAEQHLTEIGHKINTGSYVDASAGKVLIGRLAEEWFAAKVDVKATTKARIRSLLDVHVLPRWGTTPVGKVTRGGVQGWIGDLVESGQSPASVKKIHGVLSGVLTVAVKDRYVNGNPCDGVNLPRVLAAKRRYLTALQVEKLAESAATPTGRSRGLRTGATFGQNRLVVYVLAYTGLRWGELAALHVSSVDLLRRRITISEAVSDVDGRGLVWSTPKDHESREVGIPSFLVGLLSAHMAGKDRDALVFPSHLGGPLKHRAERRAWFDGAASAIGVPGLTPHELRHTAASLAVSAGTHVKAVQRMLGHASAAMTLDTYADLFDNDVDDAAALLDRVRERATESRRNRGSVVSIA
jgi:integrase